MLKVVHLEQSSDVVVFVSKEDAVYLRSFYLLGLIYTSVREIYSDCISLHFLGSEYISMVEDGTISVSEIKTKL